MRKAELTRSLKYLNAPEDAEIEVMISRTELIKKLSSIIRREPPYRGFDWYKIVGIRNVGLYEEGK